MKPLKLRGKPVIHAASGDDAKVPTFELVAYNGGPLQLGNYEDPVVIDLKGLEIAPSVVANWNHDADQVVGHASEVINDGASVTMRG